MAAQKVKPPPTITTTNEENIQEEKMPNTSVLELVEKNARVEEYETIEWRPLWRAALSTMTVGGTSVKSSFVSDEIPSSSFKHTKPRLPPVIEGGGRHQKKNDTTKNNIVAIKTNNDRRRQRRVLPSSLQQVGGDRRYKTQHITPVLRQRRRPNNTTNFSSSSTGNDQLKNMLANVSKQKKERLLAMLIEIEDDLNEDLNQSQEPVDKENNFQQHEYQNFNNSNFKEEESSLSQRSPVFPPTIIDIQTAGEEDYESNIYL